MAATDGRIQGLLASPPLHARGIVIVCIWMMVGIVATFGGFPYKEVSFNEKM